MIVEQGDAGTGGRTLSRLGALVVALAVVAMAVPAAAPAQPGQIAGAPVHIGGGVTLTVHQLMARQHAATREGVAPRPPLAPGERLQTPSTAAAERTAGAATATQAVTATPGTSFLGGQISDSTGFPGVRVRPPDSIGDVGPSQVMVPTNARIKVFDKAGNLGPLSVDPDVFFSSVMTSAAENFTSDPHVRYDRLSGRWFITMIDVPFTPPADPGTQRNRVMIAVSSGPVITGQSSFTFYFFTAPAGQFADYDTLGVDANALYVGANMFSIVPPLFPFLSTSGWVVRKADLLAGTPNPTVTQFPNLALGTGAGPFTPQGVDNDTPGSTEGYFVGVDNANFGQLAIRRVSNPGTTSPTISPNLAVPVPDTEFPENVPAQGTSTALDGLDDRLFATMIALDPASGQPRLWTAHNIEVDASGNASSSGGRDGLRWYELGNLATTPALVQAGTVFDSAASNPAYYWIPSIAANGAGQAVIASSVAGEGRFASIAAAQRFPSDPAGTMSAPTVIQPSTSPYDITSENPQRWGDYSQTVVDPNDNQTFWTFQEYANATDSWGVRAIQIKAPPPATPIAVNTDAIRRGRSKVNVKVTGASSNNSAFFDPGPDTGGPGFASHVTATVPGVKVNSVTLVDATHLTLNIDTHGASHGAHDLTVTNPDGQSATGSDLIVIDAKPPKTKITKHPPKRTRKKQARFKFKSNEKGSHFECRLDKKKARAFKPCNSPQRYKHLKPGKHKFSVRAIDKAGNTDKTPAKFTWKVLKKK